MARRLPRCGPGGAVPHLGQLGLGGRLPRWLDAGRVLQAPRRYRETNYGLQLEIRRIREVVPADAGEGFDPAMCLPQSRFDPQAMFEELTTIVRKRIAEESLAHWWNRFSQANREALLRLPAARRNHHAYVGGWLEHTLSVTRTCVYLADKYADYYPDLDPPLSKDLVLPGRSSTTSASCARSTSSRAGPATRPRGS